MDIFLGRISLVFRDGFLFFGCFDSFVGIATDVSNRNLGFLGELFDASDEFLAGVGAKGWDVDSDDSSVALGIEPQFACDDPFFDVFDEGSIEGLDHQLLGFWSSDARQLLKRCERAVGIDLDRV